MELFTDEERAEILRTQLNTAGIDCLDKIYRWTKADRNPHFFPHILKRISNYNKGLKQLMQKGFVYLVRSTGPYRILPDGIRVGGLIIELKELKVL